MKAPHGYYHRSIQDSSTWLTGVPPSFVQKEIEDSFQQLDPGASVFHPNDLTYKGTYHVGATNTTCVQFVARTGDVFTVKIPSTTVQALQTEMKIKKLPELRLARLALEYMLDQGIPEIEVEVESAVFHIVRTRLAAGF